MWIVGNSMNCWTFSGLTSGDDETTKLVGVGARGFCTSDAYSVLRIQTIIFLTERINNIYRLLEGVGL